MRSGMGICGVFTRVQATLDDVAAQLYVMSEGLNVNRLSVEHQVDSVEVTEHVPPHGPIPCPDGPFRIIIDIAPRIIRRDTAGYPVQS